MTPDRLRGWLATVPKGAVKLEVFVDDTTQGLVELANWERKEVEDLKGTDGDVADAIILAAAEHVEDEHEPTRQRFRIQWTGKRGKNVKSTSHWQNPVEVKSDEVDMEGGSVEAALREMVKSNHNKDKAMAEIFRVSAEAYKASSGAYERTIGMLTTRLDAAYKLIDEKEEAAAGFLPAEVVELSEIAEGEIIQRTKALEALTEKLPDMLDLGITMISNKLMEKEAAVAAKAAAEAAGAAAGATAGSQN